jgi:hypothetical protein
LVTQLARFCIYSRTVISLSRILLHFVCICSRLLCDATRRVETSSPPAPRYTATTHSINLRSSAKYENDTTSGLRLINPIKHEVAMAQLELADIDEHMHPLTATTHCLHENNQSTSLGRHAHIILISAVNDFRVGGDGVPVDWTF